MIYGIYSDILFGIPYDLMPDERMPDRMSDRMSGTIPGRRSYGMPNRMSEYMSDRIRMPDRMPRIYVR